MIVDRQYMHAGFQMALMFVLAIAVAVIATSPAQAQNETATMQILGFVERTTIHGDPMLTVKARLDTGARTSSLNALNMKRFERDGEKWIAFDVVPEKSGQPAVHYERPIVRNVRIVRHDGGYQRRPVVEMAFCVGDILRHREVSLVDRTALTYPLLIGRNFLSDHILVDSASSLTVEPDCSAADAPTSAAIPTNEATGDTDKDRDGDE